MQEHLDDKLRTLNKLIRFHENALAQHRFLMTPSTVYLEEETIKALNELKDRRLKDG